MKLLWRSGRRRGKADGKEKEKDIRESRKTWSGITAQKVSIVAVLFLVMYALGALTAKKAESVGVAALLHGKSENWGLGFGTEGKPPTGNASAEELKKYNAYFIGDTTQNTIYLTFDCGYENGYTGQILDTLKEKQVSAVFFLTGDYAKKETDLVNRMIAEGHVLGNHGMTHASLPTLTESEAKAEILDLHQYVLDNYGYEMQYFRCPCGEYSEAALETAQECGYRTLFWSDAYVDWKTDAQPEPAQSLERLKAHAHGGEILLLHSVSSTNAAILGDLIDALRAEGYTL